jgi:t-SNARE complex subunit (syntaxin)
VSATLQQTRAANKELTQANRFQKNARKRACWLMLILVIIVTVVLLAVQPIYPLLLTFVDSKLEGGI